jgi:hypothetical protein
MLPTHHSLGVQRLRSNWSLARRELHSFVSQRSARMSRECRTEGSHLRRPAKALIWRKPAKFLCVALLWHLNTDTTSIVRKWSWTGICYASNRSALAFADLGGRAIPEHILQEEDPD